MNKYRIKDHAEDAAAMVRAMRIMQRTAEDRIVSILNKCPNKSVKIERYYNFYNYYPTISKSNSHRENGREVLDPGGTYLEYKINEITLFNGEKFCKTPCLKCGDKYYWYFDFDGYDYIKLYNVLMNELRWQYNEENSI